MEHPKGKRIERRKLVTFPLAESVSNTIAIRQRRPPLVWQRKKSGCEMQRISPHRHDTFTEKREMSTGGTCLSPETVKAVDLCSFHLFLIFFWKIK